MKVNIKKQFAYIGLKVNARTVKSANISIDTKRIKFQHVVISYKMDIVKKGNSVYIDMSYHQLIEEQKIVRIMNQDFVNQAESAR